MRRSQSVYRSIDATAQANPHQKRTTVNVWHVVEELVVALGA